MAYISFQPGDYFNTLLWTGTGATYALTGLGFQPDLVWIKCRDAGSRSFVLTDSVRGYNSQLSCDDSSSAGTYTDALTSFNADGFTLGDDASKGEVNNSGDTFVGWSWKAGTTTGINLDSASLTPSGYSFNQTAGFSIIKWRGVVATAPNTIPHGLGVKPDMIIVKNFTSADSWNVYHKSMGATKYMLLDTDIAEAASATRWNDTEPTTTKFTTNTNGGVAGGSTEDLIAYCFASIKGYSKFDGYTGNGDADGPFVYTGFRPAFVMIKRLTGGDNGWIMFDNKRNPYNVTDNNLQAQWNTVENSADAGDIDMLSNGFKILSTDTDINASNPYCYMAFAKSPIVSSNDIPGVAR